MEVKKTKKIEKNLELQQYISSINYSTGVNIIAPANEGRICFDDDFVKRKAKSLKKLLPVWENDDSYVIANLITAHLSSQKPRGLIQNLFSGTPTKKEALIGLSYPVHPLPYKIAVEHGKVYHEGELEQDPYIRDIHIPEIHVEMLTLSHGTYHSMELFPNGDPFATDNGGIHHAKDLPMKVFAPNVATVDYDFSFPLLAEGNTVWMTVTPSEINSMRDPLSKAHGSVLMFGCGLGYSAYIASLKDDVNEITVVEQNPIILGIFEQYILPQFENKDKIRLVNNDAFAFAENLVRGDYDYCFADIWEDSINFLPYLRLHRILSKLEGMETFYWTEEMLQFSIQAALSLLMREKGLPNRDALMQLAAFHAEKPECYEYLENLTKDTVLRTEGDVNRLLTPEYFLAMNDGNG